MRKVNGSELLAGSDHEFVVNMYTALLARWPDEGGYHHHLERIANRPDLRRQVMQDVARGAEAQSLGVELRFEGGPLLARHIAVPAEAGGVAALLAAMPATLGTVPDAELRVLHQQIAEALGAVSAERAARLEARLARLEQ